MTDKSKETDPFILSNEFNEKFITHKTIWEVQTRIFTIGFIYQL